jgi:hypothetical protein
MTLAVDRQPLTFAKTSLPPVKNRGPVAAKALTDVPDALTPARDPLFSRLQGPRRDCEALGTD